MTLFKLIFEHDMLLEPNGSAQGNRKVSSLEDFLKPAQTYSRFYLSATELSENRFGWSASSHAPQILAAFDRALDVKQVVSPDGTCYASVAEALNHSAIGDALVLSNYDQAPTPYMRFNENNNFHDHVDSLKAILDQGNMVLFVEKAHHGYDIHLFSRENVYRSFFYAFKPLISNTFRFFSINGKRAKSERLFYFETWTLQRPPHGFEEVFEDTAFY